MFQTKVVDKIKTHFMFNNFYPKFVPSMRLCGKMWYNQTGHRWQYNTAHAHVMLDNPGYKHTLRVCNTYSFSTATVVTRTRLSVKFIRLLPVF